MKINVREATPTQLDWLVLTLENGEDCAWYIDNEGRLMKEHGEVSAVYSPTTLWHHGGPIIERKNIAIRPPRTTRGRNGCKVSGPEDGWFATSFTFLEDGDYMPNVSRFGPTSLIAAMRCYVASKLGNEVEIPEDLK